MRVFFTLRAEVMSVPKNNYIHVFCMKVPKSAFIFVVKLHYLVTKYYLNKTKFKAEQRYIIKLKMNVSLSPCRKKK
jgi:hypothetical protein